MRVAMEAGERKRHYNTFTHDDPFIQELLTPTIRVSTIFRHIGLREFGWSMRGADVEEIVRSASGDRPAASRLQL
jgi:hypothetical protein